MDIWRVTRILIEPFCFSPTIAVAIDTSYFIIQMYIHHSCVARYTYVIPLSCVTEDRSIETQEA